MLPDINDREDEDADVLRCLSYVLGKRFWRLAYQLGDRIGWEPGWTEDFSTINPFGNEPGSVG